MTTKPYSPQEVSSIKEYVKDNENLIKSGQIVIDRNSKIELNNSKDASIIK